VNAPPAPLSVLVVDSTALAPADGPALGLEIATGPLAPGARPWDAVLLGAATRAALEALREHIDLPQRAFDSAVVVTTPVVDPALEDDLLRLGVEAIVAPGTPAELARALRHAVQRKRVERSARAAFATDLATGLPHEAQLIEHMTQLIALREREPAPMVLLALRVEGYAQAAARLGGEAGNVLRRKVAVRLRSGLRAGDVVAAIGPETFGVLLGHLEAKGDGERVAAKLVRALQQPIVVAGQPCTVAVSVGLAIVPDHGKDPAAILQRALAQAGSVAAPGGEALAARVERTDAAANDDAR
jgi:diguanylate cyclase (GGDEF)-like protein